jgi:protein gp37
MSDVWEGCGPDDCYDRFDLDPARVVLLEVIAECPHLDFLLLTKRPGNVLPFFERLEFDGPQTRGELMVMAWMKGTPPENVWIGTTVEDQAHADERIPKLLAIPAKVRFLSCEPLLQELRIDRIRKGGDVWLPFEDIGGYGGINWVICGGESGHGARPLHPAWARSLRDQCENAGVAFFFKQWGEWVRNSDIHTGADKSCIVEFDADQDVSKQRRVYRVGKKRAGRLLDGIEHSSFPMEGHEVS